MKKVGNSYVELGRGAATNSGHFTGTQPANPIGGGNFYLSSEDMDGASEIEIFVKELWSCSGATIQPGYRHELNFRITYTANIVNKHAYIGYDGFGFNYGIGHYVYSDQFGTTFNYGEGDSGYLKIDYTGVHIRTHVEQPTGPIFRMDYPGTYYVVEGTNFDNMYINRDAGFVRGEIYRCIIMRSTGLEFRSARKCRYKYYINGTYTDVNRDSDSDIKLFDVPGGSEVTVIWGG